MLNLAKAQNDHAGIVAEIVSKVPGSTKHWSTTVEGVKCHFIAVPNILRGKTGFFLDRRILARFVRSLSPDLVHAHGTEEANALAALYSRLPSLLTVQGCFFIINRTLPPKFFSRQWIVERLERKSIPKFVHVITKSEYVQREIQAAFPGVHTHLIPNTYDPALESIAVDQPRDNAIAYVGSIDPRKGVDLLVKALEILKAEAPKLAGASLQASSFKSQVSLPSLHIFGNHNAGASDYEKAQIRDLKTVLGDRLILHGLVNQIEMAKIVAHCHALLAPSREEMFGNQLIEALLVGTHVIVTEGTAMAENVRRFGNGTIVPQEDPKALADAISNALDSRLSTLGFSEDPEASGLKSQVSDPALDSQRTTPDAAGARERISRYMGPDIVAKAHLDLYRQMLEHSQGAASAATG